MDGDEGFAARLWKLWRRLRSWRRISFTRAGAFFTAGTLAIGFAAINTGNNLLYLLLGAMLGAVAVSGWLSEQMLRGLEVRRHPPAGGHVGQELVVRYSVYNRKRRLSTFALELQEPGLPGRAFGGRIPADQRVDVTARNTFLNRGVYPLRHLTLATEFPFGLFRKERDVPLPGELVVWPRVDLPVRWPAGGTGVTPRPDSRIASAAATARGEYRGLREYRSGDDPRDIHWRSTARTGTPVIREYDRDTAPALWISLDSTSEPGEVSERAADLAASLAARLIGLGVPVALHAGARVTSPGSGAGHLRAILSEIARVDFGAPETPPPVGRDRCVRVGASGISPGWADFLDAVESLRRDPPRSETTG